MTPSLAVAFMLLALAVSEGAAAPTAPQTSKRPRQVVQGHVLAPAPEPPRCAAGVHRRLMVASGPAAFVTNGVAGYHFDVEPETMGRRFELRVVDGGTGIDLDIWFSTGWGDVVNGPPFRAFESRKSGGESGTVPPGMDKAVVCMFSGAKASFTYTAG